jgi:Flp pilus assembly protein TadD
LLVRTTVGQTFLEHGLLTQEQLDVVLRYQQESGVRFASAAVELGIVSEEAALEILARQLHVPGVALSTLNLELLDFSAISPEDCIEYRVLPFKVYRKTCVVIMADPLNGITCAQLQTLTRRQVTPVVALEGLLDSALNRIARRTERIRAFKAQSPEPPRKLSTIARAAEAAAVDGTVERRTSARQSLRQGMVLMRDGEWVRALESLHESIRLDPFDARTHRYVAQIHSRLEEWSQASDSFRRALSLDSQHFDSWCGLASILENVGDMSAALSAWGNAHENAPHLDGRERIDEHIKALKRSRDLPT